LHNGVALEIGDRSGLRELAKYLARPPVALSRLRYKPGAPLVRIKLRRAWWKTGQRELQLRPLEFLARLVTHTPPSHQKLWRQHGAYSTVFQSRLKALAGTPETSVLPEVEVPTPAEEKKSRCSSTWAALLSRA